MKESVPFTCARVLFEGKQFVKWLFSFESRQMETFFSISDKVRGGVPKRLKYF